jgi:hypothetical protein
MKKKMRVETEKSFQNILDTFTGEDGGVKFLLFLSSLREIDDKASKGDKSAEELILLVTRFSKLIEILSKGGK